MAVKLRTEPQEGIRQRFLPIIRSGNGMVFGFGCPPTNPTPTCGAASPLFCPPEEPDAATRQLGRGHAPSQTRRPWPTRLLRWREGCAKRPKGKARVWNQDAKSGRGVFDVVLADALEWLRVGGLAGGQFSRASWCWPPRKGTRKRREGVVAVLGGNRGGAERFHPASGELGRGSYWGLTRWRHPPVSVQTGAGAVL